MYKCYTSTTVGFRSFCLLIGKNINTATYAGEQEGVESQYFTLKFRSTVDLFFYCICQYMKAVLMKSGGGRGGGLLSKYLDILDK